MGSLIEEFSASRNLVVKAPFPLIAGPAAVAVAGAQVCEGSDPSFAGQRMGQSKGRVVPVIIADLNLHAVALG